MSGHWCESSNCPGFCYFSVYGSSCNCLFFGRILSSVHFLSISWYPILPWGRHLNRKRKQRSENEAEKDRVTWTAMHRICKMGTNWLTKMWDRFTCVFVTDFYSAYIPKELQLGKNTVQKTCSSWNKRNDANLSKKDYISSKDTWFLLWSEISRSFSHGNEQICFPAKILNWFACLTWLSIFPLKFVEFASNHLIAADFRSEISCGT